ncbi:hypothetical protein [Roseovarius aestuariivivens]|uniref:hypothetical protein n=1 Tax=Roseovarius aestuariivivens TaxID=1888910 RepID=UPI0010816DD7|nr:hypothetical protein [Roseovarius aestuariivivens]
MSEFFLKWGPFGAIGFGLGLFLVTMAEPDTEGGILVLMAVGLAAGVLLGALWKGIMALRGTSSSKKPPK